MPRFLTVVFLIATAAACTREHARAGSDAATASPANAPTSPPAQSTRPPVRIEMKNVRLHAADGVVLDIAYLRGEMVSRTPGQPPVFDDQRSYVLRVQSADAAMDMTSLTNLMNEHIFNYEGAPLTDIKVESDQGQLNLKAKLHKGVPIPISMKVDVMTTPDGRMRLKTEKVSALSIPAMKLMDLFGLQLDEVVSLKQRRGIEIEDNDVVIAPGQVLPPPELQGRLSRVQLVNGRLHQTFGPPSAAGSSNLSAPEAASRNYVYFSGSEIRFGKLTMTGADLQLIDEDPKDSFDFFPARYNRQLVAGYSKNTPSGGLRTYMPDYADLERVKDLRPARR